jgi:hypothetical protein
VECVQKKWMAFLGTCPPPAEVLGTCKDRSIMSTLLPDGMRRHRYLHPHGRGGSVPEALPELHPADTEHMRPWKGMGGQAASFPPTHTATHQLQV